MSTQPKEKINISVDILKNINEVDLADLCNITEQAIKAGGGFGWLRVPTREILNQYWKKKLDESHNNLIVGRLNGIIAGTLQLSYEKINIESRKNIAQIKRQFVAPWARCYGLENYIIDSSIEVEMVKKNLLENILIIVGSAIIAGIFTFVMRQMLINVSRFIEFDIKNEIYKKYQSLNFKFYITRIYNSLFT